MSFCGRPPRAGAGRGHRRNGCVEIRVESGSVPR
ncbi:hypothetical protein STAFG_8320 [Streptomyces afghaniensis 772]|uniref:Uncharacterized protein n=1 Tax=Streptomyces afghaniensis 772 TaxID=1283301 RepID=S4ME01_9ACTN|nr:hypothetical protein STAFG_8320 [Streptomyces afghaniensis 772]